MPAPHTPAHDLIALVTNSVHSPHTKRAYRDAILCFFSWCRELQMPGFNKATVQQYRCILEQRNLSPSSIKVHLAAIRRLATEMADNGLLDPLSASGIAKVRGPSRRGVRLGNWLTLPAGRGTCSACPIPRHRIGKRDRALLSVLIGAGLRRAEAAMLTFDHVQQREGRWVIVDLVGKHERVRTVPIPAWCKVAIDLWAEGMQLHSGRVFRPLNRAGRVIGPALTVEAIFQIVKHYGLRMNVTISPHDLRRSFARLAHNGHAALEQIQFSLGHESVVTTEAYLGVRQDLSQAPCDVLGIYVESGD